MIYFKIYVICSNIKEIKTYRLTTSKAYADIALEPNVITAWEFKSIKAGH